MHAPRPQIEEILGEAIELSSPNERRAFLELACADDEDLRRRVERLVACHFQAGDFLEQPAAVIAAGEFPDFAEPWERPGTRIGPYELLELIGEGGMGLVYLAEQHEPLRRLVALKIIKPGMDSREVVARFAAERQVLAMMDHPHIARILDAGTTPPDSDGVVGTRGRPYFVMELVRGTPITEFCDGRQLSVRARLELFVQVCQAVEHAHQKGIIHRDLKPTNVLVAMHENVAVPKVIDFGVAKALAMQHSERIQHTRIAQLVGTPMYMSPEQTELSPLGVDARSDIYSLGVLLYELLTGMTPFEMRTLDQVGFDEIRRMIREDNPPRPSRRLSTLDAQVLSTLAERRAMGNRGLVQHLRGDLDWIVMKTLEKDRNRRYESASALAADIQRYLNREPIMARPASVPYRVRKWALRHASLVMVMAVGWLALLTLSAGGWYFSQRVGVFSHQLETVYKESSEQKRLLGLHEYVNDMQAAATAWHAGEMENVWDYLTRQQPQAGQPDDFRGFEWFWMYQQCRPVVRTLRGHSAAVITADVSPNDRYIASGDRGGTVKIWEMDTGRELHTLRHSTQEITGVRFAPNGQMLAACGMDRTIRVWNVGDWSERACLEGGHELTVTSVAWSPDSRQLASGGRDHRIKIWEIASRAVVHALPEQVDVIRCVAWSPDGNLLAAAVRGSALCIWNTNTWELSQTLTGDGRTNIRDLAFAPDSQRLASGGYAGILLINDVARQEPLARWDLLHTLPAVEFSPDGTMLIAGDTEGNLHTWDARAAGGPPGQSPSRRQSVPVGRSSIYSVVYAHQGRTVVCALAEESVLQVCRGAELGAARTYRYYSTCLDVAANSHRAIVLDPKGTLRLQSFPPGDSYGRLLPVPRPIRDAVSLPKGDLLATVGVEPYVLVYDVVARRQLHALEAKGKEVRALSASSDGRYIAGSGPNGAVWLWDVESHTVVRTLSGHEKPTVRSAFSPDGTILATASSNEQFILLWNVATGDKLATLQAGQDVMGLAFSPDGSKLAMAGYEGAAMLWDVASRRQEAVLVGHKGSLRGVAFAPDGRTLASVGDDGTARLWHVETHQELITLVRRPVPLRWVKFISPQQMVVGTQPDDNDPARANDVLVFDAGEASTVLADVATRRDYVRDVRDAWSAWNSGDPGRAAEYLARHPAADDASPDPRGFEWHLLHSLVHPETRMLRGHAAAIRAVAVSPDDRWIASGDSGGTIKIWNLATGRELHTMQHGGQEVTGVRFGPDGKTLATCGADQTIRLWSVGDLSETACLRGHQGAVRSLAWSPDSRQLASGGLDRNVRIWDAGSQREIVALPDQSDELCAIAWSNHGKWLATAVRGEALHIWDTGEWKLAHTLTRGGRSGVVALAFAPDNRHLVSLDDGGRLLINAVTQPSPVAEASAPPNLTSMCLSPDGNLLVAGDRSGQVHTWELKTHSGPLVAMRAASVAQGDGAGVCAVAVAHSGRTIVSALQNPSVLRVRGTAAVAGYLPYRYAPACLDIAPMSKRVIMREPMGRIRLGWLPPPSMNVTILRGMPPIDDAKFFPQRDMLAAAVGSEGRVLVYGVDTGQLQYALSAPPGVRRLAISPDGKRIAGSDATGTVTLWDVETREKTHTLSRHRTDFVRMAFSPDGNLLATGPANEQRVLLWDTATGRVSAELKMDQHVRDVVFSRDGKLLAVAGRMSTVMVWDVASRSPISVLDGHRGAVRGADFSPDGRTLATVGDDGTARLWHVATGQEIVTLLRRQLPLYWARFLSSRQLAVGTREYQPGPLGASDVFVFESEAAAGSDGV